MRYYIAIDREFPQDSQAWSCLNFGPNCGHWIESAEECGCIGREISEEDYADLPGTVVRLYEERWGRMPEGLRAEVEAQDWKETKYNPSMN